MINGAPKCVLLSELKQSEAMNVVQSRSVSIEDQLHDTRERMDDVVFYSTLHLQAGSRRTFSSFGDRKQNFELPSLFTLTSSACVSS